MANKMALGKSIKMYLTIFVATTCIYMVLYQYHVSRQPLAVPEIIKNKDISAAELAASGLANAAGKQQSTSTAAALIKRYNLFLWSPMSLLTAQERQQQLQQQQQQQQQLTENLPPQAINAETTSPAVAAPISSPLQLQSNALTAASSLSLSSNIPNTTASASSSSLLSFLAAATTYAPSLEHAQNHSKINTFLNGISIVHANNANKKTTTTTTTTTTSSIGSNNNLLGNISATTTVLNLTQPKRLVANRTRKSINTQSSATAKTTKTAATTTTTSTSITSSKTSSKTAGSNTIAKTFVPAVVPPPLYIITPTYRRPEQLAELTRLGYTLKHVSNLLWLVIEDANKSSPLVTQTLNRIGVPYEYFLAPMPEQYKKTKKAKPRGVSNRNRGLEFLRANATEGVFYFADDDNTYDISIFEQMRYTKKVSMWPVGLVTKFGVSSPIIRNGKIDGFYDGWIGGRRYAVDMAGFAVSVKFLHERPTAKMPFKPGYEEDGFLKSLAPLNYTDIELLASDCTEILTWHTQTKKNAPAEPLNMTKYGDTNLVSIDKVLVRP